MLLAIMTTVFLAILVPFSVRLLYQWASQKSLRDIPGPPSYSYFMGESGSKFYSTAAISSDYYAGNISQHSYIGAFLELSNKYGPAVRLQSLLGVRGSYIETCISSDTFDITLSDQDPKILISDPLAVTQILVKDQHIFEATQVFLT